MDFGAVSWLGVLLAAVAFFAVGGLWYGPLFGTTWMRLSGRDPDEPTPSNLPVIFGLTFLLGLVSAVGLAAWLGADTDPVAGVKAGLLVAVFFALPVLAIQALYDRQPLGLLGLNAGYNLIGFVAMGAVLGALQ